MKMKSGKTRSTSRVNDKHLLPFKRRPHHCILCLCTILRWLHSLLQCPFHTFQRGTLLIHCSTVVSGPQMMKRFDSSSISNIHNPEPAFPATRPWNSICRPCAPPPSNHSQFLHRLRAPSLHLVLFFSTAQILRLRYISNKRKIE